MAHLQRASYETHELLVYHVRDQKNSPGKIEMEKKLVQIAGDYAGPYTLHFEDLSSTTYDVLVMSLPMNLVKNIQFDSRIWNGFSAQKQQAFLSTTTSSDNGKLMLECTDRHWDISQTVGGVEVHQAARAYAEPDKFISTWEGEPGNPSPLGVLVNYNDGFEIRNPASKVLRPRRMLIDSCPRPSKSGPASRPSTTTRLWFPTGGMIPSRKVHSPPRLWG